MRIKRSVTRFFSLLVLPAITAAVVGYFGGYAIWGSRGVLELEETQRQLDLAQGRLTGLQQEHASLAQHIRLMNQGDPDLVEELARTRLMDGAPNQVAVPRKGQ